MPILRHAQTPSLTHQAPMCDGCNVEVFHDGDGWQCDLCGTFWDTNQSEGERGVAYADWSGENVVDLPVIDGGPRSWLDVAKVLQKAANRQQVSGGRDE